MPEPQPGDFDAPPKLVILVFEREDDHSLGFEHFSPREKYWDVSRQEPDDLRRWKENAVDRSSSLAGSELEPPKKRSRLPPPRGDRLSAPRCAAQLPGAAQPAAKPRIAGRVQHPNEAGVDRLVRVERERLNVVDGWAERVPAANVVGNGFPAFGAGQVCGPGGGDDPFP